MEGCADLSGGVWLAQKSAAGRQFSLENSPVTRGHDESDWRPTAPDNTDQFEPVHATRHLNIGEDCFDVVPTFKNANCFISVRGCNGFEAGLIDHGHGVNA